MKLCYHTCQVEGGGLHAGAAARRGKPVARLCHLLLVCLAQAPWPRAPTAFGGVGGDVLCTKRLTPSASAEALRGKRCTTTVLKYTFSPEMHTGQRCGKASDQELVSEEEATAKPVPFPALSLPPCNMWGLSTHLAMAKRPGACGGWGLMQK